MVQTLTPAEGRSCGDCALCCKLPTVADLNKPANQWCVHCPTHHTCGYYEQRPAMCREFFCLYMMNGNLGENWKPNLAGLLVTVNKNGDQSQIVAMVDPVTPDAWRAEAFLKTFRSWSEQYQLVICCGDQRIVMFPDHEVDLGIVRPGDVIEFIGIQRSDGLYKTARLRLAEPG